jgi:hypothetical protein
MDHIVCIQIDAKYFLDSNDIDKAVEQFKQNKRPKKPSTSQDKACQAEE